MKTTDSPPGPAGPAAPLAPLVPLQLVVLISGNGSNLQAILDRIDAGELSARVAAVISDRAEAFGLARARRAGVTAETVARADFDSGAAFFDALRRRVESFAPDLVALAGFMRILPPAFVAHFDRRLINIHPSLLPRFKGLRTHQRALDAGATVHGATVHWVTAELDAGPVIAQAEVAVQPGDTAETLGARVLEQEHRIYPQAIQWIAGQRAAGGGESTAATVAMATATGAAR